MSNSNSNSKKQRSSSILSSSNPLLFQGGFAEKKVSVQSTRHSIDSTSKFDFLVLQSTAMSNSNSKKHRSSTDRISSLPDSVICHILSFLTTKDTVATSILSKRWKPLWLSVFTLDFTDQDTYMETTTLCSRVSSVMLLRDNTLPVQSFRLNYCDDSYHKPNKINQLINAAIQRRTETLELNTMFHDFDMKLASNIFTCRTLTVLKLKNLSIMDRIPQINNNNISLIKTLHLDCVYFRTHWHIIDFLLSFPVLEELQTNDVNEFKPVPKTAADKNKIKCFPNLVTAKLSESRPIPFLLLSRARTLSIKLTWPHSVQVSFFYNLTQMELFFNIKHKDLPKYLKPQTWPKKWMWMLEMLQHTPKLQHLIIHEEIENGNDDVEIWEDPKIVPECLSSQLKTCLFKNYRGKKCELQFAEYVMRCSKVLSNMTIHTACSIDLNAKHQMLQKLCLCPRGCKLIFE